MSLYILLYSLVGYQRDGATSAFSKPPLFGEQVVASLIDDLSDPLILRDTADDGRLTAERQKDVLLEATVCKHISG